MFTQFKSYLGKAANPIAFGAAYGLAAGAAAGVAAIYNANSNSIVLEECSNNFNAKASAEVVGALSGLAVGATLGVLHPATKLCFDWLSSRRQRFLFPFTQQVNAEAEPVNEENDLENGSNQIRPE